MDDDPTELEPCTPRMLREQLSRIGLKVHLKDIAHWSETQCAHSFDWAVEVDKALIDGDAVTIRERPEALTMALQLANGR
jgi:hypothetical protein